jgi:hypothetical protein
MKEHLFLIFRTVNFAAQGWRSTLQRLRKRLPYGGAGFIPVPMGARLEQNLLEWIAIFHVSFNSL